MVSALLSLFADSICVSWNCVPATVVTMTKLIRGISISKGLGEKQNKTPFVNELRLRLHQSWFHEDWNHMKSVNAALFKKWRCFPKLFVKGKKSAFLFSQSTADFVALKMITSFLTCETEPQNTHKKPILVFFLLDPMCSSYNVSYTLPCFHSSSLNYFVYCFTRT